jgi:hypothetical protein
MHEKEKSSLCGNTSALPQVKNLQLELAAKEQENSQLITDIHQLQTSMNKMRDSELAKVTMLEEQLSVKSATITSLVSCLNCSSVQLCVQGTTSVGGTAGRAT